MVRRWGQAKPDSWRRYGRLAIGILGVTLLPVWSLVQAQGSGNASGQASAQAETSSEAFSDAASDTSLPTVAQGTTRAELLGLLDQVQTQLQELDADAPTGEEANAQLLELRSQLEVLLLQAQLEQLQRENATLQTQLSAASVPAGESPDAAALERQLEQLKARQDNMNTQMEVIAHQHAEILEYADADVAEEDVGQIYTVENGDSLSELAQTYYNSAARWPEILAANPVVTNPDLLTPGTNLVIPPLEETN